MTTQTPPAEISTTKLDRIGWFKASKLAQPKVYQNFAEHKRESTKKIIIWKFYHLRNLYVVKRRGGVIPCFKSFHALQSLPRWDIMELSELELINPGNNNTTFDLQSLIRSQCLFGFTTLIPQKTQRRKKKNVFDSVTGKRKVVIRLKPIEVEHRVMILPRIPAVLDNFKKWFMIIRPVKR
ncbi:hypothetical protein L1987_69389 [Smallanthus sonchifolius]|uniref:Uncharacterized protein n=1 Tax=Smallanthus sonchifolius TaxID=185202 RepID=A0ACB9B791_9ASTR|nr:hypothetical protein L1987_69389 [Smallanthus sonchifolius]